MRKYPCKEEVSEQMIETIMKEIFGEVQKKGDKHISSYSKSFEITAVISGKREISVETKTVPGQDQETAVKLYNRFLEEVTGYTAKQRKKMVSKT